MGNHVLTTIRHLRLASPLIALIAIAMRVSCSAMDFTSTLRANPRKFFGFISKAESLAAASREVSAVVAPYVGDDYAIRRTKMIEEPMTSYDFDKAPCVTPRMVHRELTSHGYVEMERTIQQRDLFRFGSAMGSRSVNVEYAVINGKECVEVMFIDFPEAQYP